MWRRRLLLLVVVVGGALLLGGPATEAAPASGWDYSVRLEPGLKRATVELCVRGYVPKRLVLTRSEALPALRVLPRADGGAGFRSNAARDGVLPLGLRDGGCLRYEVDLDKLASIFRITKEAWRVGRDYVLRSGLLLLHPAVWPKDAQVTLTFDLPAGMRAAVPWPEQAGRYVLREDAMLLYSRIAFGRWAPQRVAVSGAVLDVALLDGPNRITQPGIARWLEVAGGAVTDLYGTFPVSQAQILVHPILPGRPRPIISGRSCLAGGAHMHVMLSGDTTDAAMPGEWLTIHEMIHLGLPWTKDADRWFQEGFVSYYQTVLRARAGLLGEREAWQRLHDYFQQGRSSGGKRSLADESALMTTRYAYHRVYWGGAALALLMDLEIRRRWPGQRTLDDAVRFLHKNYVVPGRPFPGMELMAAIDRELGAPVCVPLTQKHLASHSFPDVGPAFAALGLKLAQGRVVYTAGAPQERDRSAIMRSGGR